MYGKSEVCDEMGEDKQDFVRVNLVLTRDLNTWLSQQATATRRARSEIVRAVLRGLQHSGLDLRRYPEEDHLAAVCTAGLRSAAGQFQGHYTPA
jgi:hypothetical protein